MTGRKSAVLVDSEEGSGAEKVLQAGVLGEVRSLDLKSVFVFEVSRR